TTAAPGTYQRIASIPFVDGDGAALEGEEHLARRGRSDLDVDDGALLELWAEYVRVMLDDAALVDPGDAAFVLVADPQAAVGIDGDGAHVVREQRLCLHREIAEEVAVMVEMPDAAAERGDVDAVVRGIRSDARNEIEAGLPLRRSREGRVAHCVVFAHAVGPDIEAVLVRSLERRIGGGVDVAFRP